MFLEYNSKVAYTQLLTPPFLSALVLDRRDKWAMVKSCSPRALACVREVPVRRMPIGHLAPVEN